MLEAVIILALEVSFLLILAKKWGLLETYEATRKKWMPSGDCYFCLGWWLSWVVVLISQLTNPLPLLAPPASSVLVLLIMTLIYKYD